jgi:methyl-accepting chemotaxis protein
MFRFRGLTFQLSLLILTFAGLISVLLYGYNFLHSGIILYREVDKNAASICENNAHRIETVVSNVEKIAYNTRNFLETSDFTLEELDRYQIRTVESNPEVYGSSICFEPYSADSTINLHSVYYYKDGGAVKYANLSTSEYYYPDKIWYTEPKRLDSSVWSEPYYDEGGGNIIMSTFSLPFYRNTTNGKVLRGVITCDISLVWLQNYISGIKVYNNGYGLVISKQGKFLAHPDTSLIMKKNIFDVAKERNMPVLNILGKKMLSGEKGGLTTESIVLQKKSLVRYYPIKINGWSIAVVFPDEEIYADLYQLVLEVSLLGILGFAALFVVLVWVSRRIARPLNIVTSAAEFIADGNLKQASEVSAEQWSKYQELIEKNKNKKRKIKNEIFRLFIAINQMTNNLYGLIQQVQKSGIQVGSSANEISASSRELEANASEQAASTKEVSATSKIISQTSSNLSESIHHIHNKTEFTLQTAHQGKESLHSLDLALKGLNNSTQSITSKLSVISERANKISSVVTAINKISEQTNLLSFNAAIEAEKAGEYGKGFSVVAREISRLADQTAVATDDIEKMVREMQSSVSSGVMEMDKFSDEVRKGADHIYSVAEQLSSVIDEVNEFAPSFRGFASGMSEQTEAAAQISESMVQLAKASEQSKEALGEFRKATMQLNEAVIGMQSEVSKFLI